MSARGYLMLSANTRAYARTVKESWKLETDSGMLNKDLFVHLYRFPGADEDEMTELAARVAELSLIHI